MQHSIPSGTATLAHLYAPLNSSVPEIRVVHLLPCEDFAAPIRCQLSNRPLYSRDDSYEALSYVWGAQEFVAEILLDGEPHLITRNLEMALRYLRLPTARRTLWVDAICINQNDPVERSQQVRMMREIYANCKSDLAWMLSFDYTLKPPETDRDGGSSASHPSEKQQLQAFHDLMGKVGQGSKLYYHGCLFNILRTVALFFVRCGGDNECADQFEVDLMKKISLKDAVILDEMKRYAESSDIIYDEPEEAESGLGSSENTRPADKVDIFLLTSEHSWVISAAFHEAAIWKRVWTMQELSHAPHVVLAAGHYQLDWDIVAGFLGEKPYADAFHKLFGHGTLSKALDGHFSGAQRVDHQRRITREPGSESRLLDVLARFQSNCATDPRDRIYGLLGLVTDEHDIVVDYNKSPAQVFKDATLSLIEEARNLDMLCQTTWTSSSLLPTAGLGRGVTGLPTWAADFSLMIPYDEHSRLLFAQRGIYGAGKPALNVPCKLVDGELLQLQAVILGRVQRDIALEHSRVTWNDDQYFAPQKWLKDSETGRDIAQGSGDRQLRYTQTNELATRAYWRTLLMDCAAYPITRLTSDEVLAGDAAFENILRNSGVEHRQEGSSSCKGNTTARQDLNDSLGREGLLRYWDQLPKSMKCMWTRNYKCWTFAVTANGLYTMIQHAMTGDLIASVEGAKVPLVLRPKRESQGKKTYELVGTAYVHGFMDGEAFKTMTELGLVEDQIFLQ